MTVSDMVYYDPTSASGLRWKVDRWKGVGHCTLVAEAGDEAGFYDVIGGYWMVTIDYKRYPCHRVVYDLVHGLDSSLEIDHIDGNPCNNCIENLRAVSRTINARNIGKGKANKSGVVGVLKHSRESSGRLYWYYRAIWNSLDGRQQQKNFSVVKHGDTEAFRLACEYRAKMIAELNEQGAGYTETHGIRDLNNEKGGL